MGCYNIDVSFDILRNSVSKMQLNIETTGKKNDCKYFYTTTEMEKNNKIYRNHQVTTLEFDSYKNVINFIKEMRKNKKVHIESIYNESTNKMLYSSLYYKTIIQKIEAREKRDRSYSEEDILIINYLKNKKSSW